MSSIFNIVPEVLEENLLPLLSTNELLRFRRTCQHAKGISDDYFRRHPARSKTKLLLSLEEEYSDESSVPPSSFFNGDPISPATRFDLSCSNFANPWIPTFLEKYGNQVFELEVTEMWLPLTELELNFFQNLPKLRRLTVHFIKASKNKRKAEDPIIFPTTFRNLKRLKLGSYICRDVSEEILWQMVTACTGLEVFASLVPQLVFNILNEDIHKKLKVCDMHKLYGDRRLDAQAGNTRTICERTVNLGVKWTNVSLDFLARLEKPLQELIAPFVLSIIVYGPSDAKPAEGVIFPNVTAARVDYQQSCVRRDPGVDLPEPFSITLFPSVKRLEFFRGTFDQRGGHLLQSLWGKLKNLEELVFRESEVGDSAFLGAALYNLQHVTKLKKLELGNLNSQHLTNDVFKILRHLKLTELRLVSSEPAPFITQEGVKRLLSGPFREAIEKFPFRGWSIRDLSSEEFKQLGRQFPNNQDV